jgi:hypothetical protein
MTDQYSIQKVKQQANPKENTEKVQACQFSSSEHVTEAANCSRQIYILFSQHELINIVTLLKTLTLSPLLSTQI